MSSAGNARTMKAKILRTGLALFLGLGVSSAWADPSTGKASRFGAEVKGFQSGKALGVLYGWRFMSYESDSFSMGGAGFTGQLSQDAGTFSYGGLLGTYSTRLGRKMELDLSLVAGGGGGTVSGNTTGGGVMLEPGLGFNFILGNSVRSVLGAGYIWTPASPDFSGLTFGIRFDFLLYGGINAPQIQYTDAPAPGPAPAVSAPRTMMTPPAFSSAPPAAAQAVPAPAVAVTPAAIPAPAQRAPASVAPRPAAPTRPAASGYAPVRR